MEHGDTTILLAPLMVVAAQALCITMPSLSMSRAQKPCTKYFPSSLGPMNPVTSHLDTFELPIFYFFKFKTLSPYVEIQKSRLDALKKKKVKLENYF